MVCAITTRADRNPLDRYDTPPWMVDCLFNTLPPLPPDTVLLECCNGSGVIAEQIRLRGYRVITCDIDPLTNSDFILDMTKRKSWRSLPHFDYTISNLPFNSADTILEHALDFSKGVMVLLRKTWDEPTSSRHALLSRRPWNQKICMPRYKFRRKKNPRTGVRDGAWQTDSTALDWFIWSDLDIPVSTFYSKDQINRFSRFTSYPDDQ